MFALPAIISLLISITTLTLCFVPTGLPTWALPLIAVPAWMTGALAVKKNTRVWDIAASQTATFTIGFSLDHHATTFPVYTLLLVLIASVYSLRPIFFRQMGYMKATWWDPVAFVLALSAYVYVNIAWSTGWVGWTAAALPMFFATFMTWGTLKDQGDYKRTAAKDYSVDEGKEAPGFVLPDQDGKTVSLDEFRGKQLVLLLFVRGDWCPTCHIMLRVYERNVEKFKAKNVLVMAIGPDPVGVNREMVKKLDLDYRILADEKQEALKAYGIQYQENYLGSKFEVGIPMPASILVDSSGIVRYVSRADRAGEFLNPMRIFDVLAKL